MQDSASTYTNESRIDHFSHDCCGCINSLQDPPEPGSLFLFLPPHQDQPAQDLQPNNHSYRIYPVDHSRPDGISLDNQYRPAVSRLSGRQSRPDSNQCLAILAEIALRLRWCSYHYDGSRRLLLPYSRDRLCKARANFAIRTARDNTVLPGTVVVGRTAAAQSH